MTQTKTPSKPATAKIPLFATTAKGRPLTTRSGLKAGLERRMK